jgi:hypothetical protein
VRANGKTTCVAKVCAEGCGVAVCPAGSYGVVVNDRAYCTQSPCRDGCSPCTSKFCIDDLVPDCNTLTDECELKCVPPGLAAQAYSPRDTCPQDLCKEPDGPCSPDPLPPIDPPVPGGSDGPSCENTDDDFWPGGSHTSCHYDCPSMSLLAIRVHASDSDAGTSGRTKCADQEAACNEGASECANVSKGVTSYAGEHASCDGYSDEANSSPVGVMCYAIAPRLPGAAACYVYPPLCRLAGVTTGQRLVDLCELPTVGLDVDHRALLDLLMTTLPSDAVSVVAFQDTPEGGSFVRIAASGPHAGCELGSF